MLLILIFILYVIILTLILEMSCLMIARAILVQMERELLSPQLWYAMSQCPQTASPRFFAIEKSVPYSMS